jgi:hypothetical protein
VTTEADLYTIAALRPPRARAWLAVSVVAVCMLLGWCAWLVFEVQQTKRYTEHALQLAALRASTTKHVAELCFDGGGTWGNDECSAPVVSFSIIPFSQGSIPTPAPDRPVPLPGEPVMPIPPQSKGETRL